MSNPHKYPHLVTAVFYRVPAFPIDASLQDCWQQLKAAIKLSSPEFYAIIKDLQPEDLKRQPEKVQFSLWKYWNRARLRATPYGLFAVVGMGTISNNRETGIVLSDKTEVKSFIDWPYKEDESLSYTFEDVLRENKKVFANSSYYRSSMDYRYLSATDGKFELSDVGYSPFLETVLHYCAKPVPVQDVIAFMKQQPFPLLSGSIPELLEELIVLQLLFTEKDPNVIGPDYIERRGIPNTPDKPQYLIPVRKAESGTVPETILKHLPQMADKLARLNGITEPEDLKGFKARFKQKFEGKEVPLMVALDPELGVGYGNLEQSAFNDDLIEKLLMPLNAPEKEPEAKKFLLNKADNNSFNGVKEIDLDDLFQQLPANGTARLPNSFPALVKVVDGLVILEQMGGVTANSLLGRFSIADETIETHCRQIAELESKANPDVLFFDVAYMAEAKVDNINRRKQIYPFTLSILQYDTSEQPLTLDDILVSIKGDHIILRSQSRNQRLVPRIASAYNYTRSDLSLFRFLCDLQGLGLNTRLGFAPETFFPKQRYYPRIVYKNIVVSPAQWALKEDFLKSKTLSEYLTEIQVSRYFTAGNADQTLLFDKENSEDLQMLAFELGKKKKMFLKEAFLPENPVIKDRQGKGYNGEMIVTLFHQRQIYEPLSKSPSEEPDSIGTEKIIPPGKDWLYWEIFCHPTRANAVLTRQIAPFIEKHLGSITQWFFIRYNDGGHHIRFRIQLNDRQDYHKLESAFAKLLRPLLLSGIVTDLKLCTYKRETERYGADLIEAVEQHFHTDSEYVLSLLDTVLDDRELYRFCSETVHDLMEGSIFPSEIWEMLITEGFEAFRQEHRLTPAEIKLLNAEFPHYCRISLSGLDKQQSIRQHFFRKSFGHLLMQCPEPRRPQLFRDLLHMHANRLFPENPRTHEMVLYYMLERELKMVKHTKQL